MELGLENLVQVGSVLVEMSVVVMFLGATLTRASLPFAGLL